MSGSNEVVRGEAGSWYEFDEYDDALEHCYASGWTDGLPVALPTTRRVEQILAGTRRDPQDVIGLVPPKNGVATVEKVAINCAMAGLLPPLFPVVLTALEAMMEPSFNLNGVQATTHVCAPLVIVSGSAVRELGFNSKDGVFGGGSRANASVGRAVRLVLWNIGGAVPGDIDKSTFGSPSKFAFCIAEDPDENPWEPLHVSRLEGASADESAVTVFACEANHHVGDTHNSEPEQLLSVVADTLATLGNNNAHFNGEALVVSGPERARVYRDHGWTREDVARFLFERARRTVGEFKALNVPMRRPVWATSGRPEVSVPFFASADHIICTVAGGAGPSTAICPGWGDYGGYGVTRVIDPDEAP